MIEIKNISSPGLELQAVVDMFREYSKELNEDINFQDFEKELSNPLTKYGPPNGVLLIALVNGIPAGCIAMHALGNDETCEMKRLFVRPAYRSISLGKTLSNELILEAKKRNYKTMVLDTLKKLQPAILLYRSMGFIETEPYYINPLTDVIFMKKELA
jgi:putative acetyltransferase